jgi:uncharacterized circularly permuted ATP-grasp superfamily protein
MGQLSGHVGVTGVTVSPAPEGPSLTSTSTSLRSAVDFYHQLLDDHPDLARLSQAQLDDQLRRRRLYFGERPLCTVLRPRFLTDAQYQRLRSAIAALLGAFRTAYEAALADSSVRAQLMLSDWEERLLELDPRFPDPSPTSRMDTFFGMDDSPRLVEYNAETPAGPAYSDALEDVFLGLPVVHRFERRYDVRPLPGRHHVVHALLDAYRSWGGADRPRIAILDWSEVPTYSEFVLFREHFLAQGYDCAISDPRELEYRDGKLYTATGLHVSLIYKRVLLSELVARGGLDQPVLRAVRDGAACMVNPFRSKVLHKKASLALVSDDDNAHLFSLDERRAIASCVPWTRRLADRNTTAPDGSRVDLMAYLLEHQRQLVLKPNDEYGGKGVVLGWQVDSGEWEAALAAGLLEPTVVQQRVDVPAEVYPSLVDGRLQFAERQFDTAPFICQGDHVAGCLTRLSTDPLLNVTAGGGSTVPTFVIEQR